MTLKDTTMKRTTTKELCRLLAATAIGVTTATAADKAGIVTSHSQGLHGYIGFSHDRPPAGSGYSAGMGFYAAVWPLIDQPLADFQIGLPSSWITPDNSDNKDKPLAPEGTLARTWKERGPTWSSVFQTVEGGLGYWAGNHFRYGPPKFSMNATPQCYDYEVGSPGWSFFYSNEALPDNRLGIAQLSNRLLIPPDALPFQGNPNGEFLGYTWMALPFTDPTTGDPPTGDQSWTCFLSAANFKGPIAYYIPETWSKIGKLFNYPFLYGRGLDARPGIMGGGAMEINTVPRFDAQDAQGTRLFEDPEAAVPGGCRRPGLPGAGRHLLLEGGPLRRLQGLARRRPGLLRTIRREGRLETQADDAHDALRPGRQEDDRRGARLRHQDLRGQRVGPAVVHQRHQPEGPVPAVLQTRRRGTRRRGGGGRAGGNQAAARRSSSWPSRACPTPRPPPAPGRSPARNSARSRPSSPMARW